MPWPPIWGAAVRGSPLCGWREVGLCVSAGPAALGAVVEGQVAEGGPQPLADAVQDVREGRAQARALLPAAAHQLLPGGVGAGSEGSTPRLLHREGRPV